MPNLSKSLLKRPMKRELTEYVSVGESSEHDARVTLAAERWTPRNHASFSAAGRARAFELNLIGHQLAQALRPTGDESMAFVDVWMTEIMPRAIVRVTSTATISPMSRPRCCVCYQLGTMEEY